MDFISNTENSGKFLTFIYEVFPLYIIWPWFFTAIVIHLELPSQLKQTESKQNAVCKNILSITFVGRNRRIILIDLLTWLSKSTEDAGDFTAHSPFPFPPSTPEGTSGRAEDWPWWPLLSAIPDCQVASSSDLLWHSWPPGVWWTFIWDSILYIPRLRAGVGQVEIKEKVRKWNCSCEV